jgi:putative riboflavin transport system permease protein
LATRSISPPSAPPRGPTARAPARASANAITSPTAAERRRARRRHPVRWLAPLVLGALVLALWQLVVSVGLVNPFLLPLPGDVLRAFRESLTEGLFLSYTATTLVESVVGCALAALVALPLGYMLVRSRLIASAVQPYLAASQAMPAIAIAPLIALWLGYGLSPVIALCALIVFFPLTISTALGLRMLDPDVLDAARVDGAGFRALLWHVELPLALPSILAGLRTSLTLSITGAVVGEFVVAGNGLGELLLIQRQSSDSAGVFATLLMLGLLAAALYGAVRLCERRYSYAEAH